MADVEVVRSASAALDTMILEHPLRDDTRERVRDRLTQLALFPNSGKALEDDPHRRRYIIGPFDWMLIVYRYDIARDTVIVLAIEDGRRGETSLTLH